MEDFCKELDRQAGFLRQEAHNLAEQARNDDANLTKIRANICEICATVGRVVSQTQPQAVWGEAYLKKLDQLACSWRAGLEQAETHGEGREAAIQQVKLEALAGIRTDFCRKKGIL